MRKSILIAIAICVALSISTGAFAQDAIRFGVPPWPGVTVKTEVVAQILEAMGYETKQLEIGPPIIYKGLTTGEVDAYVASWIPQQNEMFLPLKEKKAIDIVGVNLDEAGTSMCVPTFVWEAGVRSIADLDKHADKFDHTIHGIEVGSGMHTSTEKMIKEDIAGLGDWQQVGSTTPIMLTAVQDKVRQKQWVVFHGWQPHWMNIVIDMKYLEGVPGSEELVSQSVVYTTASNDFKDRFPQAHAFLERFYVKGATQSQWIYDFGYEKIKPEQVAADWIKANMETVGKWLEGVKTADGSKPAFQAVQAAFK